MTKDHAHEAEADRLSLVVNDHGTGFQDGEHHHHYPGVPDPRVTVQASIKATTAGAVLGRPIDQWDPADLGVHDSITVENETTLTPYLPRDHDTDLRGHLKDLMAAGAGSRLVLVVGTSCTGKTRALFEGVREILPGWQLVAPGTDSDLARILLGGVPARTVVWLDELQDQLTKTSHGVTAANAIHQLLESAEVGPILVHRNHLANQPRRAERTTHPQGVIRRGRRHQQTTLRTRPWSRCPRRSPTPT